VNVKKIKLLIYAELSNDTKYYLIVNTYLPFLVCGCVRFC